MKISCTTYREKCFGPGASGEGETTVECPRRCPACTSAYSLGTRYQSIVAGDSVDAPQRQQWFWRDSGGHITYDITLCVPRPLSEPPPEKHFIFVMRVRTACFLDSIAVRALFCLRFGSGVPSPQELTAVLKNVNRGVLNYPHTRRILLHRTEYNTGGVSPPAYSSPLCSR